MIVAIGVLAVVLLILPFLAGMLGQAWVRILNVTLLYVMLALGLNVVVGVAGLLDLATSRSTRSAPTPGRYWPPRTSTCTTRSGCCCRSAPSSPHWPV